MKRLRYLWPGYRRAEEREMQEELAALEEIAGRRELGNLTLAAENARAVWGWEWLQSLVRDARYAVRVLARQPSFAVVAVLSLGLGIGANAAIYSLMDTLLWRQLPVREPERLVRYPTDSYSYPVFREYAAKSQEFLECVIATTGILSRDLDAGSGPERGRVEMVSGSYFPGLGVAPLLGPHADAGGRQRHGSQRRGAELSLLAARIRRRTQRDRPDAARGQCAVHHRRRGAARILRRRGGRGGGGVAADVHAARGVSRPALVRQSHALSQPAGSIAAGRQRGASVGGADTAGSGHRYRLRPAQYAGAVSEGRQRTETKAGTRGQRNLLPAHALLHAAARPVHDGGNRAAAGLRQRDEPGIRTRGRASHGTARAPRDRRGARAHRAATGDGGAGGGAGRRRAGPGDLPAGGRRAGLAALADHRAAAGCEHAAVCVRDFAGGGADLRRRAGAGYDARARVRRIAIRVAWLHTPAGAAGGRPRGGGGADGAVGGVDRGGIPVRVQPAKADQFRYRVGPPPAGSGGCGRQGRRLQGTANRRPESPRAGSAGRAAGRGGSKFLGQRNLYRAEQQYVGGGGRISARR